MPSDCIIKDEPNAYEKKRQRFEKIQKMRGVHFDSTQSEKLSNNARKSSREELTPISRIESQKSNIIASKIFLESKSAKKPLLSADKTKKK